MLGVKRKTAPISEQGYLMHALRFGERDLKANRAGYLSGLNTAALREKRTINVAILTTAAVVALFAWTSSVTPDRLCLVIPVILIAGYNAWRTTLLTADLRAGVVEAIQGIVYLDVNKGRSTGYSLAIGDEKFAVGYDVFNAFKNRDPYTLYIAPYSRMLLAAEPLLDE